MNKLFAAAAVIAVAGAANATFSFTGISFDQVLTTDGVFLDEAGGPPLFQDTTVDSSSFGLNDTWFAIASNPNTFAGFQVFDVAAGSFSAFGGTSTIDYTTAANGGPAALGTTAAFDSTAEAAALAGVGDTGVFFGRLATTGSSVSGGFTFGIDGNTVSLNIGGNDGFYGLVAVENGGAFDLYLVDNIPAPGAMALAGVAGLAAARRRRA